MLELICGGQWLQHKEMKAREAIEIWLPIDLPLNSSHEYKTLLQGVLNLTFRIVSEQGERKFFTSLPKSYEGDLYSSQSQSYSYLAGNTQAPQRFYLLSHWWMTR
jgi:hypothetical protein